MNLDKQKAMKKMDSANMLAQIETMPDQLREGWSLGQALTLPEWPGDLQRVVIVGMGASALGAELAAAYLSPEFPLPLSVVRGYTLPAWTAGPETLVICLSHSGTTEEVLAAFRTAAARHCRLLAISSGGDMAVQALELGASLWLYQHMGAHTSALGSIFGLLLAVFNKLGLIKNPENVLVPAITALRQQQIALAPKVPVKKNPAKRLAGQCLNRAVFVIAAPPLIPAARYWKQRINELAKNWAHYEPLAEVNHHTMAAAGGPENILTSSFVLCLRSTAAHPRDQARLALTKEYFMLEGLGTDFYDASGQDRLTQLLTTLHFGDYLAYYLAMASDVDPAPAEVIAELKAHMKNLD